MITSRADLYLSHCALPVAPTRINNDWLARRQILMSLTKDSSTGARGGGTRSLLRSPERMTERQRLAAPRPEAPPTWSLSACKGLHKTAAAECR